MTRIIAVVGPTASGKTALGIALAKALDSEIISADSMQIYRGMPIGSGAPTPEELEEVPHHFIGVRSPSEYMSAADYARQARGVVKDLQSRDRVPVMVGGSGLYVQALIDGLFEGPGRSEEIRERLHEEAAETGVSALFERLAATDPDYAKTIALNDLRRIVRALEVYELTGQPMSRLHLEGGASATPLDALQVTIDYPREELYARIDARVDHMMGRGFLDEVRALIEAGHGRDIERLKAIGFRELKAHVEGRCTLEEAVDQTKMMTRRFAKRQLTWFRGDDRVKWIDAHDYETTASRTKHILEDLLTNSGAVS